LAGVVGVIGILQQQRWLAIIVSAVVADYHVRMPLGSVKVPKVGIWFLMACAIVILIGIAWTWRGKKLPVQVQEVREVDPRSILFTLPTICDNAPETVQGPIRDNPEVFHIHEDDWRQVEFIADQDLSQVEREMAALEDFKHANRAGIGWKNVYIRKERPDGLFPSRLPYSLIDSIPHGPIQRLVIGSAGEEAVVKGGFAVRLSPTVFMYGRQSRGIIVDLGLTTADQKESVPNQDLLVLCKKFNLIIADWCAGHIVARP
jgi:hypothetical protein